MPPLQTLSLTLDDRPGALQRVITVCARRRLEVVRLAFDRAREDGYARATLCVESDPRQLAGARSWLGALVDVLAVEIGQGLDHDGRLSVPAAGTPSWRPRGR